MWNILFNRKGLMVFTWRNIFLFTVITFRRCFCLFVFFTHMFLHCLCLSKNSWAHDDVLHAMNCATLPFFFFFFKKRMLVLKSAIQEGRGTLWLCSRLVEGQGAYLPSSSDSRTQAKLWPYLTLGGNKFWLCIVPRWLPQATNFSIGISPRTMQYLGSV